MKHPKLRKELFRAIIFSVIYLSLKIFHYHLDKLFLGVRIDIITIICLLVLITLLGVQISKIIRRRQKSKGRIKLKFVFYLPSIILLIAILYTFSPIKFDSEKLESKVVLRGCYENGTSQAFIKLRADKDFEIKWTLESGYDEWYFGTYKQNKDTFLLIYSDRVPDKFGSIILNTGQSLMSLDKPHMQEGYYVAFYLGECKGIKAD